MSDKNKVLENQIGTPLTWIKNAKGEVVLDIDQRPLGYRINDFKYIYDEENDDEAEIRLLFPDSRHLNNIIFNADTILKLQWGYVIPGGQVIKSPERTVAIRDLETDYKDNGVELTLKCTDLVSYIKNVKTNTVRNKTDYFVDWLKEVSTGKFRAAVTLDGFKTVIEKDGFTKDFSFDEKTNTVRQVAIDNARFETRSRKLTYKKILKGKSLALNNAIDDLIMDLDGQLIQDSTDDVLEVRPRNFNQDIFRSFTYKGLTGELLQFKVKTDTKKVKEDKNSSIRVDPKKKTVNEKETDAADTEIARAFSKDNGYFSKEPNQDEIDNWLKDVREIYDYNVRNPTTQLDVPAMTYKRVVMRTETYMGQTVAVEQPYIYTMPAKEILNDPDLQDELSNNRLTNYVVEKLQKKYQATAKIIGDPSLVKAKIYYFANLAKKDIGRWYSVKVSHNINNGGYITEMDLIKKPSSIYINSNSSTGKVEDNIEELETTNEVSSSDIEIYKSDNLEQKTTNENIDERESQTIIRDSDSEKIDINAMVDRINQMDSDNDILNNMMRDGENTYNITEEDLKGIINDDSIDTNKYNADEF